MKKHLILKKSFSCEKKSFLPLVHQSPGAYLTLPKRPIPQSHGPEICTVFHVNFTFFLITSKFRIEIGCS